MSDEPEGAEGEGEVPEGAAVFPLIPDELGIDPLLLAVLHAIVFLDGSEEDVVDPAAADEATQYLCTYLQRLSGPRLQRVKEDMEVLAAYGKEQDWPKAQMRFLREFLTDYGVGQGP